MNEEHLLTHLRQNDTINPKRSKKVQKRHALKNIKLNNKVRLMETEKQYSCLLCDYATNALSKFTRHQQTIKHISKQTHLTDQEKYNCPCCYFTTYKQSKHVRHLQTKKHLNKVKATSQPTNDVLVQQVVDLASVIKLQNEVINNKDETIQQLIKSQQETIEKLIERPSNVYNTNNSNNNNHFNLNVFLNDTCKDALNWNEFLQNITVSLNPAAGNITEQITTAMCTEIAKLGVNRRPIHCTDLKRGSSVIKDAGTWKQNEQTLIEAGIEDVKRKFVTMMLEWNNVHQDYVYDEEKTDVYVSFVNTYMRDPDKDKVSRDVMKQSVIDKTKN